MKEERPVYVVKGTKWTQRKITTRQYRKVTELTGKFWKEILTKQQYVDFVDDVVGKGLAGPIFEIIMTPDENGAWQKITGFIRRKVLGINSKTLYDHMTQEDAARAMRDFFMNSVRWVNILTGSETNSGSRTTDQISETMKETLSAFAKSSTSSQTAISHAKN